MKKFVMSITSASVLLCASAQASESGYIISQESMPVATMASVASSPEARYFRAEAIFHANMSTAEVAARAGVNVTSHLSNLGAISFANMTEEQAEELRSQGFSVEKDTRVFLIGSDPLINGIESENFDTLADTIPYGIEFVKAPETWDDASGAGVRTCIIDTGMDLDHGDLGSNYIEGIRTVGSGSPEDQNGHGTHVAGTVAGNRDGNGIVGVAPSADLYVAAVFGSSGSTTESAILQGLDWCVDKNAQVANMSYGGPSSSNASRRAYQAAYDSGMVMVAATGNSGASTPIGYPAAYDTTIAVGATDSNDRIASFSQRGNAIDLVAPGVNVLSAAIGGSTRRLSGTSMATPHVAGAAAAVLGYQPGLSIEEVRTVLRDSADDLGAAGWDTVYGAGRLNVRAAIDSLGGGGNIPPSASFSFETDALDVQFTDTSTDSDGDIVAWDWDFGDGSSSTEVSPFYSFEENGTYTVTLTVTDDEGASRTTSQEVSVNDGSAPEIEASVSTETIFWFFVADDVTWSGATSTQVDIYQNGELVTTANDGIWRSSVYISGANNTYKVCEQGTNICSDEVSN